MYLVNFMTYPFRDSSEFAHKDFMVILESQMEYLLKETKVESVDQLVELIHAASENNPKLKKQIITSITDIKITKNFPFLKISRILAS